MQDLKSPGSESHLHPLQWTLGVLNHWTALGVLGIFFLQVLTGQSLSP